MQCSFQIVPGQLDWDQGFDCINGEHSSFCWWATAVLIWLCVWNHELSLKLKGAPHRATLIASYCKRSLTASSKWDLIRVWMLLKRQCFHTPCDIAVWQIGLHNIYGSMPNKNVHSCPNVAFLWKSISCRDFQLFFCRFTSILYKIQINLGTKNIRVINSSD